MEEIIIYDSKRNPLRPSEITLGQIFDDEIVIIDGERRWSCATTMSTVWIKE